MTQNNDSKWTFERGVLAIACMVVVLVGIYLLLSWVGGLSITTVSENTQIECKFIEITFFEEKYYYALSDNGEIYRLTQEDWVELDAPICGKH